MDGQSLEENKTAETRTVGAAPKWKKPVIIGVGALLAVVVAAVILIRYIVPKIAAVGWVSNEMIAVYIAAGVLAGAVVAWIILRKTIRTRLKMQRQMKEDPDIDDWLVVFNWTSKILYAPTIIASLAAAALMYLQEGHVWFLGSIPSVVIGSLWLAVFFVNFLIEEYSISVKVLLIIVVSIGFLLLWLHLLGWVMGFLRLFRHLALSINATGYLLIGVIGLFTILMSWLKGLFYYIAITPNYMNLQEGPTESGEQIGREDYNSRIDTSDFLERLMGFGRIVITFKDKKREPISVLVWRIHKRAQMLENVRAIFAIDRVQEAVQQTPLRQEPLKAE